VAGSKSINHNNPEEAAKEEIIEELYDNNIEESPENLDLTYLGQTHKDTDNPQKIDIFLYDSGRTDFPGSDEVYDGMFINREKVPETFSDKDVTDCAEAVLDAVGLLDDPEKSLEKLAENKL